MKNRYPILLFGLLLTISVQVHASSEVCEKTKGEILDNLTNAKKICAQKLSKLTGKGCLWDWKFHHCKSFWKHITTCYTLWSKEAKFTKHDYNETIKQVEAFTNDHYNRIKSDINAAKEPLTKDQCVKFSADIQGMASGCHSFEVNLGDKLSELEKLYEKLLGKKCK